MAVQSSSDGVKTCPYAKAKAVQEEDASISSQSMPGLVELQACPAFRNMECPFKGLDSDEVNEKLRQIPPSHLEAGGSFHKTLEFFHRQQTQQQQQHSHPEGSSREFECPVKHSLPQDWSFEEAMEEFSLAAVMGRLAQQHEGKTNHDQQATSSPTQTQTHGLRKSRSSTALSEALKSGTISAHEAAENVHFVKNFIRGKIDRDLYALLVAQLFHVYTELEKALDLHAPKHFPICHYPQELHRTQALQEDVEFWHTTTSPSVSPATQDYLDRIEHLSKTNPLLLLSHAYTRYLGDLSGGKVLARVARRALKLSADDAGLAFYHFDRVKSYKLFKDKYRSSLNELDLSDEQISELVDEANVAFLLNMRLFEELDVLDNVPDASVRPLKDVYKKRERRAGEPSEDEAKCPFLVNKEKEVSAVQTADAQKKHASGGQCPWPFILLHDPKTGMKQWKTWVLLAMILVLVKKATMGQPTATAGLNVQVPDIPTIPEVSETLKSPLFSFSQLYNSHN